jgi:carbon monoxide dehydrogenase subunit G
MELTNEFRVDVPVPEAWKVLTDVERIAPMLPGAQLQEVEGDVYRGIVKVKVGPITAQYKGQATFVDRDEAGGRVVLRATGRDTRGQGNASADITATMTPDGDGTKVSVVTDLTITGKVAQFGRGVLAEVSAKLMGQFADALRDDLEKAGTAGAMHTEAGEADGGESAAGGPAPSSSQAAAPLQGNGAAQASAGESTATQGNGASSAPAGVRRIESADAEPVDLIAVAGGSTLKRLVPVFGVLVALLVLVWARRRRR